MHLTMGAYNIWMCCQRTTLGRLRNIVKRSERQMSVDDLFYLAIIFHLVSILLGGILLSKARGEPGTTIGAPAVFLVGILIQGFPTGLVFLYSTKPGMGLVHWLLIPFGMLDAAAGFLWLLVGLGVILLTKGRSEAS